MRIWTKKLESAAEICGWLSDEQYGFRRGRSSRGAAAMVRVLAEKCDSAFCVVRGDIDRAFPSISPFDVSSMLSKLGVPSSFLNVLNHVYVGVEGVGVVNGKPGGVWHLPMAHSGTSSGTSSLSSFDGSLDSECC